MDIIHPTFWQMILLCSPLLLSIALFGYLLWSDARYYKEKSVNK